MSCEEINLIIRKYSLQNAIFYKGKANTKAVMGRIIAACKEYDIAPKDLIPFISQTVKQVNTLNLDQQIEELKSIAPDLLKREKKERTFDLPELPFAENYNVITRFPPEPNGYLHIGHAKAAIIDYEYAQIYQGIFILRFDDTNPENAHEEFYNAQKQDLKWLNLSWDKEYCTSDNLSEHYKLASQLIQQDDAYVCTCTPEEIKKNRFNKKPCNCRSKESTFHQQQWSDMLNKNLENVVLRLKAKIQSNNTAMRDPTLFRIINSFHPRHGTKYHVWPTYDFAGAVEDSLSGVTHPFRTKEYELRDECYFYLLDKLNLRKPYLMEFARLSITGMPVSKRHIKPLITSGKVSGYDDIRLPTLKGLEKRGISAEAIHKFVLSQGISKVESHVDFGLVEAINRKLIDPNTPRYFFVQNPKKIVVKNAPKLEKIIPLHPTNQNLGNRKIMTSDEFFIPEDDVKNIKKDDIFRLKELYNVQLLDKEETPIIVEYHSENLISGSKKIQWTTDDHICMIINIPHQLFINDVYNAKSLEAINGYAESAITKIKSGSLIQFERFGFVRIIHEAGNHIGYYTHK
jgi:glutamyl-tRNA synthetase